ncbi:MAG: hypothetical protein EVA76_01895 [Candidatus Pelagibacterales bacterium]|nr:MAG: hypothetical protein EVA76_01895 [Pelagibacterales bacterium]
MYWLKLVKKKILTVVIYIFLFEILFQTAFFADFKFIKQPDLFYNGYCDQKYWNLNEKRINYRKKYLPHSILSFQKKGIFIPHKFHQNKLVEKKEFLKNEIALYGASYLDHPEFKNILEDNKNLIINNYALESYGLDQTYLSYKLTSHLNQNKTIVFGFLLEDLDRSIFNFREYQKVQFIFDNNKFELKNTPIKLNKEVVKSYDFYLYRFLKNFYNLSVNKFDPRLSKCKIDNKKDLFNYYFQNIVNESKKYNQKIIVITFNLQQDLTTTTSWRYKFIKNYFAKHNIIHIDSLEIMNNKSIETNEKIENYFGLDAHNNKKSFHYIIDEFLSIYRAI